MSPYKMYELKLHPEVNKFLNKVENSINKRIRDKLNFLKKEPFRFLRHFEGDHFKLRIGDYRALIDVDTSRKVIFIRHINHRKKIYKKYKSN